MNTSETSETLLTFSEVVARIGNASRASLWRWIRDGIFPAPVKIGLRRIAWRESEITSWLKERR
jgi:prophage regulatory protein